MELKGTAHIGLCGDSNMPEKMCPLSKKEKRRKIRRCIVDGKMCYTPYLWLYKDCKAAKKYRETHKGIDEYV